MHDQKVDTELGAKTLDIVGVEKGEIEHLKIVGANIFVMNGFQINCFSAEKGQYKLVNQIGVP